MKPSPESRHVLDAIRSIVRALRVSSRAVEQAHGLSGAQLFVLQKLAEGGRASINALAQRTLTHQSSVSVVVGRLVEQGLVVRKISRVDSRKSEVSLSALGLRALKEAPEAAQERLIAALEALPRQKRKQLALLLDDLSQRAGFALAEPPLFFEEEP